MFLFVKKVDVRPLLTLTVYRKKVSINRIQRHDKLLLTSHFRVLKTQELSLQAKTDKGTSNYMEPIQKFY